MLPHFENRLHALAEVVVRIGINLQPGQPLLITDPYELQGIHPEAAGLAHAVGSFVVEAGSPQPEIALSTPAHLRALVEANDTRTFDRLVADHVRRLQQHLNRGGAFLFLTGSEPRLFQGLPAEHLAGFDRIKWRHLGPLIQQLIRGATQWTLIPAPTLAWADIAYDDLTSGQRLDALWRIVFEAFRIGPAFIAEPILTSGPAADTSHLPLAVWRSHLADLARRRDGYNAARHRQVRYVGPGTELTLALPQNHLWCTAQQVSKRSVPFVVNLPTEEIFTAPHRHSAEGRVRVARPVVHAGTVIDGITLEFVGGRVVVAHAESGQDLLRQLLATDEGASRLGEVAIVPDRNVLTLAGRCFHHTILDENTTSHIALGDAYRFCSRAWLPVSLNSSQIHVDLPLDARIELS